MSELRKVKTAVVGCGMISNIYIRNLKNLFSIIDLAAICDINRTAAEEKAKIYGIDRIMSVDEVAESAEIELVVNLTGPAAHYDVIKRMLLAGKHVFTEKMMTTDLEKGRELVALAEEKGLYLGVAPDTILGAGLQTARKVLDAGMIGEVTSCVVSINRNQSMNSEMFRFLRSEGGSLPYDVGIYYVAALLSLLGPVESICAFGEQAPVHKHQLLFQEETQDSWQIPGYNLMTGTLKFRNGVLCSVHFNGNTISSEQSMIILFGTEGILKVGDPNQFNGFVKLIKPEGGECLIPHSHGYNGASVLPEPSPFDGYGHRGVGAAEMAWAIRKGRKNRCSKEYGLHCMEVLCGMESSADTGKVYRVQSDFEIKPLRSGYYSTMEGSRGDAELSLVE